ncbi:hypothetical protein V1292_002698 [Bradyrhizobium sp. AZCC 1719]|uniref:hypothetical protein n=1 Tax=Bradyrhizobium sp. AZCC 1719 TaxID=3117028 RepID=UPI002FEFAEE8
MTSSSDFLQSLRAGTGVAPLRAIIAGIAELIGALQINARDLFFFRALSGVLYTWRAA